MTAKKRKVATKKVAKKKATSRKKSVKITGAPNSSYLNAIAYLVSSEENETKLMVASTMGLVGK